MPLHSFGLGNREAGILPTRCLSACDVVKILTICLAKNYRLLTPQSSGTTSTNKGKFPRMRSDFCSDFMIFSLQLRLKSLTINK